jgi:hypothetical protein
MSAKRENALQTFPDIPEAQAYGAVIRAEAIARLPELLEEFEKNATANGAKVIWVRDTKELNETIVKLIKERGASYVTKGKSMVTEESGLNDVLTENGIEPFETDLGEFIAQLLKRPPFHIVGPAINVPRQEVCDIFMEKAGMVELEAGEVKGEKAPKREERKEEKPAPRAPPRESPPPVLRSVDNRLAAAGNASVTTACASTDPATSAFCGCRRLRGTAGGIIRTATAGIPDGRCAPSSTPRIPPPSSRCAISIATVF